MFSGALLLAGAVLLRQQSPMLTEDLEPKIIGRRGTTVIGFSGFADRYQSSEDTFPTRYILTADVTRFVTGHVAIRLGAAGSGTFNDDPDDTSTGREAAALHGSAAALWYFTPKSLASFYAGGEYTLQLTEREPDAEDRGYVFAKAGLQAAVSSRASLFVEAGYGYGLTRGSDDELITRMSGQIGVRIRF